MKAALARGRSTLRVDCRDKMQAVLREAGIPTVVYYPRPLSRQPGYCQYPVVSTGVRNSELLADNVLSLPMHPYLDPKTQDKIVSALLGAA